MDTGIILAVADMAISSLEAMEIVSQIMVDMVEMVEIAGTKETVGTKEMAVDLVAIEDTGTEGGMPLSGINCLGMPIQTVLRPKIPAKNFIFQLKIDQNRFKGWKKSVFQPEISVLPMFS